ncbi:MAG: ABC transporter permease [Chloroflexi bacterium]|nr:ABC transporter permease [Chloroflexota bacterium]
MGWHLVFRSLGSRKGRLALAGLVVVLGAGLVSALANLTPDVSSKMGGQLRAYGANITVLPRPLPGLEMAAYLDEDRLAYMEGEKEAIASYVPFLYSLGKVEGQRVVLVGARLEALAKQSTWWLVQGSWPASDDEVLVGGRLARKLRLKLGQTVVIGAAQGERQFRIAGLAETGSAEEDQVFLTLSVAQELTGRKGQVSLAQVSAWSEKEPLSAIAQRIEQAVPAAEVRVVGQVARAETQVLEKVRLLMLLVASLVLVTAGLAIFSVMATSFLERTKEIGLMKALGASEARIASLFGAEALVIALGGGLLGYGLGYGLAQFITLVVFGAPAALSWQSLGITLAAAVGVTFAGGLIPIRRAAGLNPAVTLKEE